MASRAMKPYGSSPDRDQAKQRTSRAHPGPRPQPPPVRQPQPLAAAGSSSTNGRHILSTIPPSPLRVFPADPRATTTANSRCEVRGNSGERRHHSRGPTRTGRPGPGRGLWCRWEVPRAALGLAEAGDARPPSAMPQVALTVRDGDSNRSSGRRHLTRHKETVLRRFPGRADSA